MNFLSGQDDFFQTGNQPISVRQLSQPHNNNTCHNFTIFDCLGKVQVIVQQVLLYLNFEYRVNIKSNVNCLQQRVRIN